MLTTIACLINPTIILACIVFSLIFAKVMKRICLLVKISNINVYVGIREGSLCIVCKVEIILEQR
jgi:hypothetical protein